MKTFITSLTLLTCSMLAWSQAAIGQEENKFDVKVEGNKVIISNGDEVKTFDLGDFGDKLDSSIKHKIIIREEESVDGKRMTRWNHGVVVGADGEFQVLELEPSELSGQILFVPEGEGSEVAGTWRWVLQGQVQGEEGDQKEMALTVAGEKSLRNIEAAINVISEDSMGGYMIGVSCEPVSEPLNSQLNIEGGLVVTKVFPETAASDQIEVHDVIVKVDGEVVLTNDALSEAVQVSGKKCKPLSFECCGKVKKWIWRSLRLNANHSPTTWSRHKCLNQCVCKFRKRCLRLVVMSL